MKKQLEQSLTEQALEALRHDIVYNVFQPKSKLPIDLLKTRYTMGGTPIREALNQLVSEKWVEALPLRGFRVLPVSYNEALDLLRTIKLLENDLLQESLMKADDMWESEVIAAYYRFQKSITKDQPSDYHLWYQRWYEFLMTIIDLSESMWLKRWYRNSLLHLIHYQCVIGDLLNEPKEGPLFTINDYQSLQQCIVDKDWNACQEELKQLNTIAYKKITEQWLEILNNE